MINFKDIRIFSVPKKSAPKSEPSASFKCVETLVEDLEKKDLALIKVAKLDRMAENIESFTGITYDEKLKLLTRLDRLYNRRQQAKGMSGKSKQYCHKYKIKIGKVTPDSIGYGSLCVGHSRKA